MPVILRKALWRQERGRSHIPRDLMERGAIMRCQNERVHEKRSDTVGESSF